MLPAGSGLRLVSKAEQNNPFGAGESEVLAAAKETYRAAWQAVYIHSVPRATVHAQQS